MTGLWSGLIVVHVSLTRHRHREELRAQKAILVAVREVPGAGGLGQERMCVCVYIFRIGRPWQRSPGRSKQSKID